MSSKSPEGGADHGEARAARGGDGITGAEALGWLARAGLIARSVVYFVIGLLALKLALGDGGRATDQEGAMKTIASQSSGEVLLILLAIGLAGYSFWRLTRAIVGHGVEQRDSGADRIAAAASGVAYAALFVVAIGILVSAGGTGGSAKEATGGVLGWSLGPVLVAIAGLGLVGVAIYQAHRGLAMEFLEDAKTDEMSPPIRNAYTTLGVFGHVARAVIFALVGYGLAKAAIDFDPKEAVGLDGALRELANAALGPFLLALVAIGLAGFGLYSAIDSRYRKV